ncbi:MAG: thiol-disulfide oxidoreductase DCC family protein [Bacteroidetes bacterium]|nr:MAG: thiol-disulfide oxidoreductase DCC family protein [Bacteroidota bacterium]
MEKPILLFDGVCNLCDSIVQFIIKADPEGKFMFASLQSEKGQELLKKFGFPTENFDSFVLIDQEKSAEKSTAALQVLKKLGGFWQLFYIFILIPKPIRDFVYEMIAKNRYRFFGKKDSCLIPTPELKARFF